MLRRTLIVIGVIAALASTADARRKSQQRVYPHEAPYKNVLLPPDLRAVAAPQFLRASADTFQLGWFTFDTSGGQPSAQGWTSADRTDQLQKFFHVASSSGELDGGSFGALLPLEGNKSMWCGVDASSIAPYCGYANLPGYGNGWRQMLRWVGAAGCDSVCVTYEVQWDTEGGYDQAFFQYSGDGGQGWSNFTVNGGIGYYDGFGSSQLTETFYVGGLASVDLRFYFESDDFFSDEDGLWSTDGAILLDSLTVEWFAGGISQGVTFSDFESSNEGDFSDGAWTAELPPSFGNFAAMYPGATQLQEDPCHFNASNLWAFLDDVTSSNYGCRNPDPQPQQATVPYIYFNGNTPLYMDNEIWSPLMPNIGSGDRYRLRFNVYRDLAAGNDTFYTLAVRSWIGGCPTEWRSPQFPLFFGSQRDWFTHSRDVSALAEPNADFIQVALGVFHFCGSTCGLAYVRCPSHSPMFDNVRVERIDLTGPQIGVRHIDLFQDTFAEDGTTTGTARADMAQDILPSWNGNILPGDSVCVTVTDITTDPNTGSGPSAYCYIAVWPPAQPGKAPLNIEAPESRSIGKRFPYVGTTVDNGVDWYCFRMDSVFNPDGMPVPDRYCIDLNDTVFNPCDTICYFFGADDGLGNDTYWTRKINGQGDDWLPQSFSLAASSPCEFQVLPGAGWKRGGDILYVDDTDDRGGPVQLYFDTALEYLQILHTVDRYDVLGPSSNVGNSLASRVLNAQNQIIDGYDIIMWNTGDLSAGLIGDGGVATGGSGPEKSDDYALLFQFLDTHPDNPLLYVSGDDVAEEWVTLTGAYAGYLRSIYMGFNLVDGDHVNAGEPVSPLLTGVGPRYVGDELIAYGGCPLTSDFDIMTPTAFTEFENTSTGAAYIVSQHTPNSSGSLAHFVLSGFSYHRVSEVQPVFPTARIHHLRRVLGERGTVPQAVPVDPQTYAYRLDVNYPNPFNPTTTIGYEIKTQGHVTLRVYNAAGQLVRTLVDDVQTPQVGGFRIEWDGRSNGGSAVSSGVYFYRLVTAEFADTKKMVLLK